jgi:ATP-binding cassette subfamily B protein/subfamily B ATP-binding cassette protein MsbA
MSLYRRILFYYRPYAGQISIALLLLLVTRGLFVLTPWPQKYLVDNILTKQGPLYELPWIGSLELGPALGAIAGSLILLYLLWGAFNLWNNYWLIEIGLHALFRMRTQVYAYLQSLPLRFHDRHRSGDSTFRVAYDAQAIQTFFNRGFATIIGSGLTLAMSFGVMWKMDPKLTLVSLMVVPLLLWAIFHFAERIRDESTQVQQQESDVYTQASEGLSSVRVIHAFGRQEEEADKFARECQESLEANRRLSLTNLKSSLVVGVVTALGTAGFFYFGAQEVKSGALELGEMLVFINYLLMLYQPLEQLSYTVWAMEGAAAATNRVFEILDTQDDVPEKKNAKKLKVAEGRIEARGLVFGYEPEHPVLKGLTLDIQAGKTTALVGGTGAGKTTLLSLIPRFYDPQQGSLQIDGQDLRDVTKRSLREAIAVVLQDTILLSGTIRENIAYGKPGCTEAEIVRAAEAAQADSFIRQLPEGYNTQVGERGMRLSGGQRQRIGIARAFLKDSPILLLDEPTSALDLKTESGLMSALEALMRGRTTVIVAHRLSTIHRADRIYVLADGRVAEEGSGAELLAQGGLYAELWNMQQPGGGEKSA